MHLLKILGTRAGSEYGYVEKIVQVRRGMQSNAFALACSMAFSSAQDRSAVWLSLLTTDLAFSWYVGSNGCFICGALGVTNTPTIIS